MNEADIQWNDNAEFLAFLGYTKYDLYKLGMTTQKETFNGRFGISNTGAATYLGVTVN